MKKYLAIIITIVIIVLGFAMKNILSNQKEHIQRRPQQKRANPVKVIKVKNQSLTTTFKISGYLNAYDKVDLYAEVSGVLLETPKRFKEGTRYSKDDELIHIDDSVYRNNVLAQKSSLLNQLTLLLPDLSIDFPESAANWENYLENYDLNKPLNPLPETTSQQEKYYIASRNIYNQFYSIKGMEETLAKYTLQAPFNGVITESNINLGTLVRQGQKLGEFTNTAVYELEATAKVSEVSHLQVGKQVILTSEDFPGEFTGKIARINDVIDAKFQSIKVYITTNDKRLKEGMFLSADIVSKPFENVIRIKRNLLEGNSLYTITQDSTLELIQVDWMSDKDNFVIVEGLENGTLLLGQQLANAQAGMKIENMAIGNKKSQRTAG